MKSGKSSIILPTRNVEKYIGPLLNAIYSQEYDGEIEVLIMDSSSDRTAELAKAFPVKYIWVEPDDFNWGKTRNEGVVLTDGEFIIFLSADIEIINRKWLSILVSHFSDSQVAGIYGRQVPQKEATPMEQFLITYAYPSQSATLALENGRLGVKKPVYFSNVNSAIRRSIWERIKFPEMLANEDQEWAKRALLAGYKIVYDSDAAIYHSHNRSLKDAFQWYFDVGASMTITHANPIISYSMWDFITDGLSFIRSEYKFMFKNGYWYLIPYAVLYDIFKFLGIFLGSKQKYIPIWMKRALSKKKNHWDKYSDVLKEAA
jgi:rhamnosyltransferase